MPQFKANGILVQKGKVFPSGAVIELTEEQAERLGKKVIPLEVADPNKPIKSLDLKQLKGLAKIAGIDGYSRKNKKVLIAELTDIQQGVEPEPEPAPEPSADPVPDVVVDDDEPSGD